MSAPTATRRPAARHDADPGVPAVIQLLLVLAVLLGGALAATQWLDATCPTPTAAASASLTAVCDAVRG